tara:strand:+ start:105 stop:449 length:345 start_codon:yes stop_codon:yes gene_type:complete
MKQSHTSGPWAFNPSIDNTESYHGYHIGPLCQKGLAMDNLVKSIAFTSNSSLSVSSEECLANAQLIAAAPEMLAALAEIKGECESMVDGLEEATLGVIAMKARKAITKATEADA